MAFSIDSGIDSLINESVDDGDDGDGINYPVESKINDDLTEDDIWTYEEEHERRKSSQSVNDGTALHNFDSIFPSNFEVHTIPEPNRFFGQMLSMFKKVPLDEMIIAVSFFLNRL
uniref:PiggyBac transposable element-derived protein domain-containing protein n=1 Tax=Panagrolaimus davidi TaxID=227884 RepID=A0A914P2J2_9BILA